MTPSPSNEQGRRRELNRFGYRAGDGDPAAVWRRLRADFPMPWAQMELSDLAGPARTAAERYCAQRGDLDDLLDRCDEVHLEIFREGPERERVETYALARDAYEDAVEHFGELRVALQAALMEAQPA